MKSLILILFCSFLPFKEARVVPQINSVPKGIQGKTRIYATEDAIVLDVLLTQNKGGLEELKVTLTKTYCHRQNVKIVFLKNGEIAIRYTFKKKIHHPLVKSINS